MTSWTWPCFAFIICLIVSKCSYKALSRFSLIPLRKNWEKLEGTLDLSQSVYQMYFLYEGSRDLFYCASWPFFKKPPNSSVSRPSHTFTHSCCLLDFSEDFQFTSFFFCRRDLEWSRTWVTSTCTVCQENPRCSKTANQHVTAVSCRSGTCRHRCTCTLEVESNTLLCKPQLPLKAVRKASVGVPCGWCALNSSKM